MLTRAAVFFFVLFAACRMLRAADDQPPVLTVCEALTDPDRYNGKSVVIVGRSSSTDEGRWLGEDCGLKVKRAEREFRPIVSTTYFDSEFEPPPDLPNDFKWNRRLLQEKLDEVKKTTRLRFPTDMWAAKFGRLETKLPRRVDIGDREGYAYAIGFGHLSAAPAQLVGSSDGFLSLGSGTPK
jgi:hypothetical protein